jgi:phage gp29-like protein
MEANYALTSDSKFTLNEIVVKPLEWFEPKNDGRLIYRQNAEIDVNAKYPLKFFLTRRKPTFKQPYGDPLLSKLYWLWFFRTNTTKFWVKFLERFGTPILLGKWVVKIVNRMILMP